MLRSRRVALGRVSVLAAGRDLDWTDSPAPIAQSSWSSTEYVCESMALTAVASAYDTARASTAIVTPFSS